MHNFQAEPKASYSLLVPPKHSKDIVIFVPGMACNMYGHPYEDGPQGVVADIAEDFSSDHNILFVDVNRFADNHSGLYAGEPIQAQAQQLSSAYNSAFNGERLKGRVLYIGQSLGSLAVSLFARSELLSSNAHAIFVAPPTSEGQECTDSLIAMFSSSPKTAIDTGGNGVLQFGKDQMMSVNEDYWKSIEENSLRQHSDSLTERCNLHCAHCFVSSTKNGIDINLEDIVNRVIPRLAEARVSRMTLTGGEPFAHPHLFEICEAFVQQDMSVGICTNATCDTS